MKLYLALAVGAVFTNPLSCPSFAQATTIRVSVASDGTQGNGNSGSRGISISADGRYVAFDSDANNLVTSDTDGANDIFVRDTLLGTTTRVSVASDGAQANGFIGPFTFSAGGRYVAFQSPATNLVEGDTNGYDDVFVRDMVMGVTTRVSLGSDGVQANAQSVVPFISADGRFVAFVSGAPAFFPGDTLWDMNVYVRDNETGAIRKATVAFDGTKANGNGEGGPCISADNRYVAFHSTASNLVTDDTNDLWDIYLRDMVAGTTSRVSVATDGAQGNGDSYHPSLTANGTHVAFTSSASTLVPNDTNGYDDVFVHDAVAGTTQRVSVATDGTQGNGPSFCATISADGRYIAFGSGASNLTPGDTNGQRDVFVRDTVAGTTTRVSVAANGAEGNDATSYYTCISADGRYVAFRSSSTNLVTSDTNGYGDVFVRGPLFGVVPPFSAADAARCMQFASGLAKPSAADAARFNVEPGNASVTLADAVLIARKVAGLEANP